jgi:hypothetical protein
MKTTIVLLFTVLSRPFSWSQRCKDRNQSGIGITVQND